jgi:hypothetical protein
MDRTRHAIDQAYAAFVQQLPTELELAAQQLPRSLGHTCRRGATWGELLETRPQLGLPMTLLSECSASVDADTLACAQRAHLFALIAGDVVTAIDADTLTHDAELDALLSALERERNRALAGLRRRGAGMNISYSLPMREVRAALAREHDVLAGRELADFATYLTISSAKQSLAFPAIMAAVSLSGATACALTDVHDVVLGVMLGLQIRADVQAWLDAPRSRSWINALAHEHEPLAVIEQLLDLACDAFNKAADAARGLEAGPMLLWARTQANAIRLVRRRAEQQLGAEQPPRPLAPVRRGATLIDLTLFP